jgi:hypothetical protein
MKFASDIRRASALAAACSTLFVLAAPAAYACASGGTHAAAQKQSERDAWFLRQMARTDGNVDPR